MRKRENIHFQLSSNIAERREVDCNWKVNSQCSPVPPAPTLHVAPPPLKCPQRAMARGKRTRPEDKGAVLALHDYGLSTAEVSKRTGIHVRTVRRIVSRGGAGAEECKRDGGPKRRRRSGLLSHAGVEETIRAALKWDCTLYQDELADVVSDLCDVVCTRHAIGRALRALGIKRKQVRAPPPNLCDYADSVATSRFPCAQANATRSCGWTFVC